MNRAVALCDAYGTFPEPLEQVFPGTGRSGAWPLHVHCFVLLVAEKVVLVDAGGGPPGSPAAGWFPRPGQLLAELGRVGLAPEDVTHVILTHLHVDHVGWTVHGSPDRLTPTFPNARHLVQQTGLTHLKHQALYDTHVRPLRDADLLDPIDGPARPLPGVDLVPTPGHTPGHQCVAVDLGDETLLVAGDAFVHPAQLADPHLGYRYDADLATAAETRRRLLHQAARRRTVLAPAHFPATFGVLEVSPDGNAQLTARETCRHGSG